MGYTYNKELLQSITHDDRSTPEFAYTYDSLQRLTSAATDHYTRSYTYRDIENSDSQTTTQVCALAYSGEISKLYEYTYNALGHMATYQSTDEARVSYTYDNQGQLTQAAVSGGPTYSYTYDSAGNILTVSDGSQTNTYTYNNSNWRDLLTAYNNQNIAYEGQSYNADTGAVTGTPTSGNPVSYYNGTRWTLDWAEGRNLVSAEGTVSTGSAQEQDISVSYSYDADGLRTGKTVTVETYELVETVEEEPQSQQMEPVEELQSMEQEAEPEEIQESESVEESTLEETSVAEMSLEDLVEENQIEETTEEETVAEVYSGEDAELISEEDIETIEPLAATRTLVSTHTEHHDYIYAGGKLLRDTIITTTGSNTTTEILDFRYDENGYPYSLIHTVGSTTTTYYYITNLQGDVMYLVDDNGTPVASYTYDPYGNILTATGSMAEQNPLRYRGYYYDEETGFYYLQSRYYDAEIERFLNADSYLSTGQSFLGHNAFAYCGNNPVNRVDADGEIWITVGIMGVGGLIGAVVSTVSSAVTQKVLTGTINWKSVGISSASGLVSGAIAARPLGIGWLEEIV